MSSSGRAGNQQLESAYITLATYLSLASICLCALAAVGILAMGSRGGGGNQQRLAVCSGCSLVRDRTDRLCQPLHALLLRRLALHSSMCLALGASQ